MMMKHKIRKIQPTNGQTGSMLKDMMTFNQQILICHWDLQFCMSHHSTKIRTCHGMMLFQLF